MAEKARELKRFSCVVAVARNNGIGYQNRIPWPRIKTDLKHMARVTTETVDPQKQNAVVMGRRTWESLPSHVQPLKNRYNVVLTSKPSSELLGPHLISSSLQSCMETLSTSPLCDQIEGVYILGGASVYEEALRSPLCDRVYYTDVMGEFPSDVFFTWPNKQDYHIINDDQSPQGVIEENGVQYQLMVYQRTNQE